MLVGTTTVLTGLGFAPLSALGHTEGGSRTAETIHQEPVFKANSKRVYEALTDEKQFEKVTQLSAAIQSGVALENKPISRSPRSSFEWITSSARSAVPISKTISSAGPGAPPCNGPLRAPTAPVIAETKSECVETITRAANVEALRP